MCYKDLLYKTTNYSFLSVLNISNPFYLMLDKKGVILSAGSNFKRATGDEMEGKLFASFFKFNANITFGEIQKNSNIIGKVDQIASLCNQQIYKVTLHTNEDYLFLFASPVLNEKLILSDYKLHLNEIPTHDYIIDYLKLREKLFKINTNLTEISDY